VIEQLSATAPDPAFRDSILPRTGRADPCGVHAGGCKQLGDLVAKLAVTIKNRIAVRARFRKCLPQLLHDPEASRVFRDVEMENFASTMFDDEETVQNSEGEGRYGKEVHGGDDHTVITQESPPEFPCLLERRHTSEVPRDGTFRDLEAEFQKLTVNPRSAPGGILFDHPPDQRSKLGVDLWPAKALGLRAQAPEQTKASAMPGDHGFWFDNDEDLAPCRPKTPEQDPKDSILDSHPRARKSSLEYAQLLPQRNDLETEAVARTEESAEAGEEAEKKWNHGTGFIAQGCVPVRD